MTNDAGGPIGNLAGLAEMLGTHEAHRSGSSRASVVSGGGSRQPLCEGEMQARLLGKYWLGRGVIFQKAYSSPRVRQRETSRLVAEVHRSVGQSFPEIAVMSEFDEFPAQAVMRLCFQN